MSLSDQFVMRMAPTAPTCSTTPGRCPTTATRSARSSRPSSPPTSTRRSRTAEQLVAQAGITRSADVFATGVSTSTTTRPGCWSPAPSPTATRARARRRDASTRSRCPFRFTVDLVMIDGEWLVDDFNPVTATATRRPAPAEREHAVSDAPDLVRPPRRRPREPPPTRSAPPGRTGIADLEPGDRRFHALNRAAEVLLDPRRSARRTTQSWRRRRRRRRRPEDGARRAVDPTSRPTSRRRSTSGRRPTSRAPSRPGSWPALGVVAAGLRGRRRSGRGRRGAAAGDEAARSSAQAAAEQAVVPVLSYDYEHLEADQKRAQAL